jgi:hypothetical protein
MRSLLLDLRCGTPQLAIGQRRFTRTLEISDNTLVLLGLTEEHGSVKLFLSEPSHLPDTIVLFLAQQPAPADDVLDHVTLCMYLKLIKVPKPAISSPCLGSIRLSCSLQADHVPLCRTLPADLTPL